MKPDKEPEVQVEKPDWMKAIDLRKRKIRTPRPGDNRLLSRHLVRQLESNGEYSARELAKKMIEAAMAGSPGMMALIWERVEGKVPSPVVGQDGGPVQIDVRVVALGQVEVKK